MTAFHASRATVFEQVLGDAFMRLVAPVHTLHRVQGRARYVGQVSVVHAARPVARLLARITHLPRAMRDAPLVIEFDADPTRETWVRSFDGHRMRTQLHVHRGALREWLGPVRFTFALTVDVDGALLWRVARVEAFGVLPLPAHWFDEVRCREFSDGDRYTFDVRAAMPLVGVLVHYSGWLQRG